MESVDTFLEALSKQLQKDNLLRILSKSSLHIISLSTEVDINSSLDSPHRGRNNRRRNNIRVEVLLDGLLTQLVGGRQEELGSNMNILLT